MRIAKVKKTYLLSPFNANDTSLTLKELEDHKGNKLTYSNFDNDPFVLTIRQGRSIEMVLCNSITQNANGSATIGVATDGRNLDGIVPFGGHASGKDFGAGAEVVNGNDPYTIWQITKIYTDSVATFGAPLAGDTTFGIAKLSVEPDDTDEPVAVGDNDPRMQKIENAVSTPSTPQTDDAGKLVKLNASGKLPDAFISPPKVRTIVYTTSGTWIKPDGLIYAEVIAVGGGGGGGGAEGASGGGSSGAGGGGGGGGATVVRKIYASMLSATEAVTIGGGGAGAAAFNYGGTVTVGATGNTTTFGSHVSAVGGVGGNHPGKGFGGGGGVGSYVIANNTTVNSINGGAGFNRTGGHPSSSPGGKGGNSLLGEGGTGSSSNASAGSVGVRGGGGGGGFGPQSAGGSPTAGGSGGAGIVIVHEFF